MTADPHAGRAEAEHEPARGGFRRNRISRPIFAWARRALPGLSATEREALEAGGAWWDGELFTGSPDWRKLLETPRPELTEEERAFFDGDCVELCAMLDDWDILWRRRDLPPEVWRFLRERKFFGMIIPKERGGLGFSSYAQSEILRRIATRSMSAGVTVMVPNSLGPGELLLQYGTEAQKAYWLPRLADGREIPCFALTSDEAGSDAASMVDEGVVAWGEHEGERVLGMRLNWRKRYITLGPVATVIGLAFKLRDPDGLLGDRKELGITVALVPTDLEGVRVGRRHIPCGQAFQNGPNEGRDVFVPLDAIIGGRERIGQGWKMLMGALAAGRGVSLPSLAAAATTFAARSTGAYARIREQFGVPIGKFEGVQERLARLAGLAYELDAARRFTCAGLDVGHKPSVVSAIMKAHATYRMRRAVDDAMDVHGGKTIIDGPRNYLGNMHRTAPIAITVEGANILTRSLIIYGQGVIRCHPHLLDEMLALEEDDPEAALDRFDRAFWSHVRHSLSNFGRAWARNWSGGRLAPAPKGVGGVARHYRQLSRYAASLALVSDLALLTLGGALKRKELISARLGDLLSELYLLSAVLKRFEDDGRPESDLALVEWCMESGFATLDDRIDAILRNLPSRPAAWLAKAAVQPLGPTRRGPSDRVVKRCAEILIEPSEARERLTAGVYCGKGGEGIAALERAFALVTGTTELVGRMKDAAAESVDEAVARGVLSEAEGERLRETARAVAEAVAVDDFEPGELSREAGEHAKTEHPAMSGAS